MQENRQTDYRGLSQQARQLNDEFAKLGSNISQVEASGSSADGMVTATVTGNGSLVSLDLDPSVIRPDDPIATAEPVIDAVNNALRALATRHQERIAPLTETLRGMGDRLSERH
jgi:DNA-binding YbaB/EbfC family protein